MSITQEINKKIIKGEAPGPQFEFINEEGEKVTVNILPTIGADQETRY